MVVTGIYGNCETTLRHRDVARNVSDPGYYHTNHLGSTAFVTDNNATISQGFLYAPFGEITTEYNATFANGIIPKYTFNAKELDEETGMYYYEARYMAPPTFISRDPMFEQKPWLSPYHYCSNNPVGRVDPSGMMDGDPDDPPGKKTLTPQPQIVRQDNLASKPLPNTSYTSSPDAQGGDNSHPMATAGKETAGAYANASKAWNDYGKSHNGKQEQYKACYDASKKLKAKGVDVKTAQLKNGVNQAAKYSKVAARGVAAIDAYNVYDTYKSEGKVGIETSKAAGGAVGGWIGTKAGALVGAYVGGHFAIIGAVPGAIIGGFIGSMGGSAVGEQTGVGIYTRINRNK